MNEFDKYDEPSMRTMRGDTNEGTLGRIDQYEIIRKLGGGGFGVVYLVRDTVSNVEYAIKTLHPLLKSNLDEMENLRQQFVLVSKLMHTNIASAMLLHSVKEVVYATEEVRNDLRLSSGDFVMVMKYAPGVTLYKWRKQFPGGVVPEDKAVDICKQIASALDYAHSEKIIHRDIKPGNIMIETREDGSLIARVLDFGLASEIRSSMSRVSTDKGDTSGTRPYMSPEQWQGKRQGPATDQYALACLFYELVSGAVPFAGAFETGDSVVMVNAVENNQPERIDELSEEQNNILQKALSKSPKDRFSSCSKFIEALANNAIIPDFIEEKSNNAIICDACGFGNLSTSVFCKNCGNKLTRYDLCIECGSSLTGAEKFCIKCGAKTPTYLAQLEEEERRAREEHERIAAERAEARRIALKKANAEATRIAREAREEAERIANDRKAKRRAFFKKCKKIFLGIALISLLSVVGFSIHNYMEEQKLLQNAVMEEQKLLQNAVPQIISDMVKIPDRGEHKGLYIGKYEVTQAQWQAVMGNNQSSFKGDLTRPVESVSWNDCQEFINKLNALPSVKESGLVFCLPTEEEWEYACRAGSKGKYGLLANGREGMLDEMGWYCDNSGKKTHPVGQKKPNAWGLYDMHGNVWEWTSSEDDGHRINRGGSWINYAKDCESDRRRNYYPGSRYSYLGFRLAAKKAEFLKAEAERIAREKAEAERIAREKVLEEWNMVKIPDSAEHKGLYFGKYEVTQALWLAVMGINPSEFTGDLSRPVECVSWYDCQKFIKKLNALSSVKESGLVFRLPTEEEWEYACRAGSKGKYGLLADGREGTMDEMGWYDENSGKKTHLVGQKKPNAWGVYDMHGNVWEWTSSEHSRGCICRGGGWINYAKECESDSSLSSSPGGRYRNLGFRLAAKKAEAEKAKAELISNMVRIPDSAEHKGLYLGKYEVTQALWQAIMGNNPSSFKGDLTRPVECVSWNDCLEFINKLNALPEVMQSGLVFRLPTEEEWEYACRAESKGKYGLLADGTEGTMNEMGWYDENSGGETHPVGKKKPNAWGLYDMHGNVREWTSSEDNSSFLISRGGSWGNSAKFCESGHRRFDNPDRGSLILGFRLAASRTEK